MNNRHTPGRVYVRCDTTYQFSRGDKIILNGAIYPFGRSNLKFANSSYRRGYVGSVSLKKCKIERIIPVKQKRSLHGWACSKLKNIMPDDAARRTILSMAIGERETDTEMRNAYSRSGSSHLLAVSGLHVGIVFVLVNILLKFILLLPGGNILRSILAIFFIWLYVAMCEFPPSAVRSAVMFSMLQLSLLSARQYSGINILAVAAASMLLFSPRLIYDVGFQMSFGAVAAILVWGVPIVTMFRTEYHILNTFLSAFFVGLVASIAVMPLVSNTFSIISIIGIILSPFVVLFANVILFSAIASIIVPISLSSYVIMPAYYLAKIQNAVVEYSADLSYGSIDCRISDGVLFLVYTLFIVATLWMWGTRTDK